MVGKSAVKILVVEDNPAVLELLRNGMESCGAVVTARDGAEGLLKAIEEQPDLVIADYQMPGLNGHQLYEKLRARQETQKTPFIFLASKGDIEEKLRQLTDGVEDYIAKPFYVREVVARAKKVADRLHLEKLQTAARRPGVIEGRLEEMNVIDLFQSLEMGQKTCSLTLTCGEQNCQVFMKNGQVYDAVLGTTTGDAAVYQVVEWSEGTFEIDFKGKSPKRRTTRSTQGLLMEAMRLLDEARRDQVER
ncbi:MAG: response regulator [Terriglobia bacterium]